MRSQMVLLSRKGSVVLTDQIFTDEDHYAFCATSYTSAVYATTQLLGRRNVGAEAQ